jgi:hypothetical protein
MKNLNLNLSDDDEDEDSDETFENDREDVEVRVHRKSPLKTVIISDGEVRKAINVHPMLAAGRDLPSQKSISEKSKLL